MSSSRTRGISIGMFSREGDQTLLLQVDLDAAARQQFLDSSLRRPDFCIAIRKRVLSSTVTSA